MREPPEGICPRFFVATKQQTDPKQVFDKGAVLGVAALFGSALNKVPAQWS